MLQIKYMKCVSIVIRNFTVCWFKSNFLKKNFAGINFRGLDKSKHFAGTNFRNFVRKLRKLVPAKISTIKVFSAKFKATANELHQEKTQLRWCEDILLTVSC